MFEAIDASRIALCEGDLVVVKEAEEGCTHALRQP